MTVPYVRRSGVGLAYVRQARDGASANSEKTHIFELNPEDWTLLVKYDGWKVVRERIHYQYPRRSLYRFTKFLWRRYDYEGFLGLVLRRDHTHSDKFQEW